MGLLASLFLGPPRASTPAADADYWYRPVGTASLAGVNVSEDTVRAISTVYRCVAILGGMIGYLPLMVYRSLAAGGKEPARNHPLWTPLHAQPNSWQTSFEWRELGMNHLLLRGNFYNEILEGPRGFADQLVPLHPDHVRVEQLDSRRLVYIVRRKNGRSDTLVQDQVFHVRGPSKDGITGLDVITLMRESTGIAAAAESFGARMFRDRPMMAGILKHPGKINDEVGKRMATSFQAQTSGANAHLPAVLEDGTDWVSVGVTPEQAQYLETRRFSIEEIARWFGVPLPFIGAMEKSTAWGTGIESLMIGMVIMTLAPWAVRWQQAISRDLILAPETYFAEFTLEALLRGDTRSLYEAFRIATGGRAWMAPNEVRSKLNLNPVPGYDEIAREAQGAAIGRAPAPRQRGRAMDEDEEEAQAAVATRELGREIAAVRRAAVQHAGNDSRWRAWVARWYEAYPARLAEALGVEVEQARGYCRAHEAELLAEGIGALERWEHETTTED